MIISRRFSLPGRFCIFWLLWLMYPAGVFASHPIDSLEKVLPTLKMEQRIDAMNKLATQLRRSQPEKALQYAQRALAISDSCHYTQGIALSNQTLGVIYYTQTSFQLAQTYHREALRLFQSLGDQQNLARELRYLGMVEVNQSRYQSALDRYEQALKIFKELKSESGAADCYGNIATVYNFLGDYQKAIQYSFKSLKYREKTGDKAGVGFSYNSIGFLYTKLHKYVYALNYLEKSHQTAIQNKDQVGQIFPLINMGEVYRVWGDDAKAVSYLNQGKVLAEKMHHQSGLYQAYDKLGLILRKQGQLEKALHLQMKALAICEELKNKEGLVTVMNHIGAIHSQQQKYRMALGYYQKSLSLAQDIQSKPMIKECYLSIAQTSYRLNDFVQSARYYELYQGTQDTLFNEITERVVVEIQQKYEAEKKASEIRIIQQEKEIKELALEKAHTQRNMLLFIVCLGIIILILAVYLYLVKHRSNEELRSVNGRLSESEAHLQQINQTKDKLFSIVAHDLRGPINSLSALLQMQAEYPDSFTGEELKGFLHKMNGSVKNLSSLLDNLLHWSLAQMGHIEFAPEPLQLEAIVENNFRLLEESARTKGVYLKNDLSTQIRVSADRNMVDIVLRNLINNAIKFSHQEGRVLVHAQTVGKYAHISISDQGVGIPADRLATLFHQRQTHSTRGTGNEAGTGLGLLLCQEFVERCGGNIQVKSEVNEGTTFTFTLPMN
jgi:signal transduction histidine kinase